MNCKRAAEVIFLFVDEDQLDDGLKDPFRQHLEHCPQCKRRAVFIRKLFVVFRTRCVRYHAPTRLRQRILTSLPHRSSSLQID
jgi:anti-sigma factor (TIGR02949 family)